MRRSSVLGRCRAGLATRTWLSCPHQPSPFFRIGSISRGAHAEARGFRSTAVQAREPVHHLPTLGVEAQGPSDIAFAFDIDGVLTQGKTAIPGAVQTLRMLRARGIPYILLTNGGGSHENDKVKSIMKTLGLEKNEDVILDRVILSHTPMRGWAESVKKEGTVFITGSNPEAARRVAKEYGFARVVTPADIDRANGKIYPFAKLGDAHSQYEALPDGKTLGRLEDPYNTSIPSEALKIDHILVWNDPRDWSLDIQLIHDLLASHKGYLGTLSSKNGDTSLPNNGWQQDGQPDLWISNLDLLWKTDYPINRFGTGAFVEALKGVWSAATGGAELQYKALGKPSKYTYEYAHDRLLHYRSDLAAAQGKGSSAGTGTVERRKQPLRRVYMIGDNPESDIRGANEFKPADGTEWLSILVNTGVWQETEAQREPKYKPAMVADDVVDAVLGALKAEGVRLDRPKLGDGAIDLRVTRETIKAF